MSPEENWHDANKKYNGMINQLFHAENWQGRAEAARRLGLSRDGRATNLMCRALKNEKDKMVSNRIIEAMGRIGDPKATMIIIEKLKEEMAKEEADKFSLIYIIESLTKLKDKRALVYLGPLLSVNDDEISKLTENAYDLIEPNWRSIIKNELKKRNAIEEAFGNKL